MTAEKHTGPVSAEDRVKLFSRDEPARPLFLAYLLFLFIAYVLYLTAYFMPTPHWGRELMAWATPTVQGLGTAARVALERQTDPFPAQVVILYCALGMVVLIAGGLLYVCGNREFRESGMRNLIKHEGDGWKSRRKAFLVGLAGGVIFPFMWYSIIFHSVINITWRDHNFFSSSIGSISFLLLATVIFSFGASMLPLLLLFAFKSHAISSSKGE